MERGSRTGESILLMNGCEFLFMDTKDIFLYINIKLSNEEVPYGLSHLLSFLCRWIYGSESDNYF